MDLPAGRSCKASLPSSTPQVFVSPGRQTWQEQKKPWQVIYDLIMCEENMMFCLHRQSKLLCGRQRPFVSNVIPSNRKGKLRANSNRMLGGSFVQLPWTCCCSSEDQYHDPPFAQFASQLFGTLSTPRACCTAGRKRWLWPVTRSTRPGGPGCLPRTPPTLGTQHKLWLALAILSVLA